MYFQIAVTSICTFFKCKSYVRFHMYFCSKLHDIRFRVCFAFYFYHNLISEGILPVSASFSVHLSLLIQSSTFSEKSDCDKINLVLIEIIIITVLVLLRQINWGYDTRVKVCQSVILSLSLKWKGREASKNNERG